MNYELLKGDALELLKTIPVGSVDAVITDPPYGVLNESWDTFDAQGYAAFTMQWLGTVRSLNCPLITFAGERTRKLITPLLEMLYDNVRQLVWDKGSGGVADTGFFYCYESIYFCYPDSSWEVVKPKNNKVGRYIQSARTAFGLSRSGVDIALRGKKTGLCFRWEEGACLPTPDQAAKLKDLLNINGDFETLLEQAYAERDEIKALAKAEATKWAAHNQDILRCSAVSEHGHPCEKPVPLLRTLINTPLQPQRILDPFMGTGSTGIAALHEGKQFIGIERDENYYRIASERFERHVAQPKLFTPETVTAEQEVLF